MRRLGVEPEENISRRFFRKRCLQILMDTGEQMRIGLEEIGLVHLILYWRPRSTWQTYHSSGEYHKCAVKMEEVPGNNGLSLGRLLEPLL